MFTYAGLGAWPRRYVPPKAPRTATADLGRGREGCHRAAGATGTRRRGAADRGTAQEVEPSRRSGTSEAGADGAAEDGCGGTRPRHGRRRGERVRRRRGGRGSGGTPRSDARRHDEALLPGRDPERPAEGKSASNSARLPLRVGALVSQGTVLGHMLVPPGAKDGHLRFSIRPAGDPSTIDPGTVLANWEQLGTALHPPGAPAETEFVGSHGKRRLPGVDGQPRAHGPLRPGHRLSAAPASEVGSGKIDRRLLAVLAFLSRSGLKPTVGTRSRAATAHMRRPATSRARISATRWRSRGSTACRRGQPGRGVDHGHDGPRAADACRRIRAP